MAPDPDLLYRWPDAAHVGSRVPKEKLYEQGRVTSAVREKFVAEVQRVTWAYKLAEATINLTGSKSVPEVQVFQIEAKSSDVPELVITVIDKAIPYPIIFEVIRMTDSGDQQVRMVAAHKELGAGAPKLSAYYSTGWLPADTKRESLPTAIALPALYSALLAPLIPITTRPGEDPGETAARVKAVQKLEREVTALERKISNEPQFNRKIELRRTLKAKQIELDQTR